MRVLLWSVSTFGAAFLLHLSIWKIRLPEKHTRTLLIIFLGVLALSLAVLGYVSLTRWAGRAPLGEYVTVSLFTVSLALSYIITYSALEVDSPSLVMVKAIADAGKEGLEKDRFDGLMTDDVLVKPRVNDLLRDGLATLDGDKYVLTPKGESFIKIFIFWRGLLKAPLKGG